MFVLGDSEWDLVSSCNVSINIFWFLIMPAMLISKWIFFPILSRFMQLLITQFFIFTCIWHVVMSPPLFLQCGVEWHLHRHHFCVVHMTSPPFICSVHTGLSFLLATLPRFANVFLCSSSSRELFLSSCQCYTIFLCTKTVSDLDFYHFLPSTGFGVGMMLW